jgi:hypothetical protein
MRIEESTMADGAGVQHFIRTVQKIAAVMPPGMNTLLWPRQRPPGAVCPFVVGHDFAGIRRRQDVREITQRFGRDDPVILGHVFMRFISARACFAIEPLIVPGIFSAKLCGMLSQPQPRPQSGTLQCCDAAPAHASR